MDTDITIGSQFHDEDILNCENDLMVLLGNILLLASPRGAESIFIERIATDDDIDSEELSEFVRRKQINSDIQQTINSHSAKWIPYQSTSNDDGKTTITSAERI